MRPGLILLLLAALCGYGCTRDALPQPAVPDCSTDIPVYDQEIRPIVEASCAYSGCHLDSAPGNYQSYDGLLSSLEDGSFRERVVLLRTDPNRGMPPNYAPDDRPHELTEEELLLIECWLEAGYPQN